MAALPAGVQYGLSSESSYNENKDLVFVKLTDSSLRAIEDFIRNSRGKFGATPTIEFLPGNEGKITIPCGAGLQQPPATFHFSLSNNADMEGPQGSFECVRGNAGGRRLEACGQLTRRMRVHANDDSYEATKHRMARTVAEEQSKCTREIKTNHSDIGRRVKRTGVSSRSIAPVSVPASSAPITSSHHATGGLLGVSSAPAPAPREHGKRPNIKERLIQLLALKPFKKPELYARLTSEGIDEKEKRVINTILQQISSLKDNCYQLHRHIWNDVNEEWPYYTEDEKRQLKRRKPQNLTPPLSSDSSQSLSPRASPGVKRSASGADDSTNPAGKKQRISHYRKQGRPATPSSGYATGASSGERHLSDTEDGPVKKDNGYTLSFNTAKEFCPSPPPPTLQQPRVSAPPASSLPVASAPSTLCRDCCQRVAGPSGLCRDCCQSASIKREPSPKAPGVTPSPPISEQRHTTDSGGGNDQPLKDITPRECLENMEASMTNLSWLDADFNMDELERQFPPIVCQRERRAYKAEFARDYDEYRAVYERVERTAALFARLERRLRAAPPASPDHQQITKTILDEYRRTRADPKYLRDRRRCHRLHAKLQLIKERVASYDQQKTVSSKRVAGVQAY